MTREEAAEILDGRNIVPMPVYLKALEEAAQVLVESQSLARKAPAKLDRSRWEGCWSCNNQKIRELGLRHGREYCPCCGRPLTEKAWAELERRINDGTVD